MPLLRWRNYNARDTERVSEWNWTSSSDLHTRKSAFGSRLSRRADTRDKTAVDRRKKRSSEMHNKGQDANPCLEPRCQRFHIGRKGRLRHSGRRPAARPRPRVALVFVFMASDHSRHSRSNSGSIGMTCRVSEASELSPPRPPSLAVTGRGVHRKCWSTGNWTPRWLPHMISAAR